MKIGKSRGVEPVIAALLLIAIAVFAAVITYSYVSTMIANQGTQAQTSFKVVGNPTASGITIQNTGSVALTITGVSIDGVLTSVSKGLQPSEIGTVDVTIASGTHNIIVIASTGFQVSGTYTV